MAANPQRLAVWSPHSLERGAEAGHCARGAVISAGCQLIRPLRTLRMRAPNARRQGWKAGGWGSSCEAGRQRTGAQRPQWGACRAGEAKPGRARNCAWGRLCAQDASRSLAGRIPASRTRCLQAGLGTVPPGWAKVLGQDKATCSWVTKLGAVSFFSDSAVPTEDGEASRESS